MKDAKKDARGIEIETGDIVVYVSEQGNPVVGSVTDTFEYMIDIKSLSGDRRGRTDLIVPSLCVVVDGLPSD